MKLSAVQLLRREIEREERRLEEMKLAATNTTAKLDGLPRVKAHSSKVEKAVQIVDSERRLAELRAELVEKSLDLNDEILKRVSGQSVIVLIMRYIGGKSFEEISAAMKLSRSYVSRLHSQGVKEFEEAE